MTSNGKKLAQSVFKEFFEKMDAENSLPAVADQDTTSNDDVLRNVESPFVGFWKKNDPVLHFSKKDEQEAQIDEFALLEGKIKTDQSGERPNNEDANEQSVNSDPSSPNMRESRQKRELSVGESRSRDGALIALLRGIEEFHENDPGCIIPDQNRGCSPQGLGIIEDRKDLFFAASPKRFVLKRWVMEEIRRMFEARRYTSLSVLEIHDSLRKAFRTYTFSLSRLRKLLDTREELTWSAFASIESRVLHDYTQVFAERITIEQLIIQASAHELPLGEMVAFIQVKAAVSKLGALAYLLLSPFVCFDAHLKPYYDETGSAMDQDIETLFWRIGMLYANGLLQKEVCHEDSHEMGLCKPLDLDVVPLAWPKGQTQDWPLSRLYCWEVPLWLIDHLTDREISTMSALFSARGATALHSSLAKFEAFGASTTTISHAIKNINTAFDFLTGSSPDIFNPWFLDRLLLPGADILQWEMLLCRVNGGTLEDAGAILGVTRERARQIQKKAMQKFAEWLIRHGEELAARTQRWPYVVDEALAKMLLGDDGWSVFLGFIKNMNTNEWFYWPGPNLVLKGVAQEFFELLDQVESALDDQANCCSDFDTLEKEFVQRGYHFVTTDILEAHFKYHGYQRYGNALLPARLTLGQAIVFIAEHCLSTPLRMSDSEALTPLRCHLAELGVKYKDTDRNLWGRIQTCLVLCDRGSYVSPARIYLPTELCEEICKYVEAMRQESITYVQLFHRFHDQLLLESNIHNYHFLHGALMYFYPERFIYKRDHLTRVDAAVVHTNSYHLLEDFLKRATGPVSKAVVLRAFQGWTDIRLAYAMEAYPDILSWGPNLFLHASKLQIEAYEIQGLGEELKAELENRGGYISSFKIFEAIRLRFSSLLERNAAMDEAKAFALLKYLFKEKYYFMMPHIVHSWSEFRRFTHEDLILRCLGDNQQFTRSGLLSQMNALIGHVRSGPYMAVSAFCKRQVRLSNDEYLMKESFNISEEQLASIVSALELLLNDYRFLLVSSVDWSTSFPPLDFPWTPYLLAEIISKHLPAYKVIGLDNAWQNSCAVVRASDRINSREDIAIWLLSQRYSEVVTWPGLTAFMLSTGLYEGELPTSLKIDPRLRFCEDNLVRIDVGFLGGI